MSATAVEHNNPPGASRAGLLMHVASMDISGHDPEKQLRRWNAGFQRMAQTNPERALVQGSQTISFLAEGNGAIAKKAFNGWLKLFDERVAAKDPHADVFARIAIGDLNSHLPEAAETVKGRLAKLESNNASDANPAGERPVVTRPNAAPGRTAG